MKDLATKIFERDVLRTHLGDQKLSGRKIVFTNGCFDLIHVGHVKYFAKAKELGDLLIVAVNSDSSVNKLKGMSRPLMVLQDRLEMLASLECIDFVTSFDEDTPIETIKLLKPDIHVKGGDYNAEALPESEIVNSYGGKVVILPYIEGRSTSGLIERILEAYAHE